MAITFTPTEILKSQNFEKQLLTWQKQNKCRIYPKFTSTATSHKQDTTQIKSPMWYYEHFKNLKILTVYPLLALYFLLWILRKILVVWS